ncbi:S-adenosyl-L-methionine-dependent methyltransferase [Aaosphaeria arxii CBS 175.79]|uniref:S-adenosyl-L-methionine-dependent methyltransferase n=1 Tax=Aaosphaeria arxii CBS 175.79 TaxID=1450172 RepID=A0A6A5YBK2_9PLEO|nr:S-adenosyl-L-methionine-dependent methyltransferase [Aaosphaeria arxii CBS 175.79]KAF2022427.1 S-adenosyl-L-methionine-dependent methyltransferase [Aaosphaeria arxii CBS 175.79]
MATRNNSTLLELAKSIQELTSQLVDELSTSGSPEPTFDVNSTPIPETAPFKALQYALNDSAQDLLRLVNGPKAEARTQICNLYDLAAWQVACEFNFFDAVPEEGTASVEEISKKVGVDEDRLGRFLRILATERVFEEVDPNVFRHTAKSVLHRRDRNIRDAVHYQLDEFFKATSETASSIKETPQTTNRSVNPFVSRHGMELFQFYQNDRARADRFASAMAGIGKMERQFEDLRDCYAWGDVSGKVVDVGGGNGHMSVALARTFPTLHITVQDSLSMLSQAMRQNLSDLAGRVTFLEHDFFDVQPITDAKAYLLRYITHNWSDQDCIRIFRAMVPALEKAAPGTPFLINDIVLPEAGGELSKYQERRMRQIDIMMMVVLGGKQRSGKDFERLLKEADERFHIKKIHSAGDMGLVEAVLDMERAN